MNGKEMFCIVASICIALAFFFGLVVVHEIDIVKEISQKGNCENSCFVLSVENSKFKKYIWEK